VDEDDDDDSRRIFIFVVSVGALELDVCMTNIRYVCMCVHVCIAKRIYDIWDCLLAILYSLKFVLGPDEGR